MTPEHKTNEFSLSNPRADSDYYSVPKLLRRLADHPEEFGHDATVRDLLLEWDEYRDPHTNECNEQEGPSITVYCNRRKTALAAKMNYFPMTNPEGEPDRYSVPKLLRRVADRLDELGGDAVVLDLIMHIEVTGEGYLPWINIYYYHEKDE